MKTKKNCKVRIIVYLILSFAVLTAVLLSDIAAAPEIHASLEHRFLPPSIRHLFGTDDFGRDVFLRTLQGFKYTFFIALTAQVFSFRWDNRPFCRILRRTVRRNTVLSLQYHSIVSNDCRRYLFLRCFRKFRFYFNRLIDCFRYDI